MDWATPFFGVTFDPVGDGTDLKITKVTESWLTDFHTNEIVTNSGAHFNKDYVFYLEDDARRFATIVLEDKRTEAEVLITKLDAVQTRIWEVSIPSEI